MKIGDLKGKIVEVCHCTTQNVINSLYKFVNIDDKFVCVETFNHNIMFIHTNSIEFISIADEEQINHFINYKGEEVDKDSGNYMG